MIFLGIFIVLGSKAIFICCISVAVERAQFNKSLTHKGSGVEVLRMCESSVVKLIMY